MALKTGGTTANNVLNGFQFFPTDATDIALFMAQVLDDVRGVNSSGVPQTVYPGAFSQTGQLFVPNRGVLLAKPGDWVFYDATGWPILLSKEAIAYASTSWAHS